MALRAWSLLLSAIVFASKVGGVVVAEYANNWQSTLMPASSLPFGDGMNQAYYFVAVPNLDGTLGDYDESFAQQVIQAAGGTPVSLVVGGWTGSANFSQIFASSSASQTLASTMASAAKTIGFQGLQIDWEYPVQGGESCNGHSPNDATNLITFLQASSFAALQRTRSKPQQLLRQQAGSSVSLSIAMSILGIQGLSSYTELSAALDYGMIMAYDVVTPLTPGQVWSSSPLFTCPGAPAGSASSAIQEYTSKGFEASKLLLGLASYGYSWGGVTTAPSSFPFAFSELSAGGATAGAAGPDSCGQEQPAGSNWLFSELVGTDLAATGLQAASGWQRIWDNCTQTPILYDSGSGVAITYEDPESIGVKAAFARCAGLGGVAFYSATGDTSTHLLLNAALSGLNGTSISCPAQGGSTSVVSPSSASSVASSAVSSSFGSSASTSANGAAAASSSTRLLPGIGLICGALLAVLPMLPSL